MNYPLLSEYLEAIKSPEDNFDKLRHLRPVLDDGGNPYISSGNFAVVFKMTDGKKDYAIKCFTREQEGREEAYRQIAEELENVSSAFLCPIRYLEKELFVDTKNCTETEFPVLQMDWVDGVTLDKFVHEHRHDKYAMDSLAYHFCRMAQGLLTQPFAHGDLKPDNILVQSDGSLMLVDYDGMFVPAMKGEKARELGSPNYRHPLRTEERFDEHIDDFALASIALSLKAIALNPELYDEFGTGDRLLFSDADFRNLAESKAVGKLQTLMSDADFLRLYGLFLIAYAEQSLANVSFRLLRISKPAPVEILSTEATKEELAEAWEDEFGVKYSKDGKKLLRGNGSLSVYSIKPGTKVICDRAFYRCSSLKSINIPNSVSSIGDRAFYRCSSLKSINIPNSVSSIGDSAFWGCDMQINIDSSRFYSDGYCLIDLSSHRLLCMHNMCDLENYSIPDSVKSIGDGVFYRYLNLKSINIPNSVKSIGNRVFEQCSSLQSIYIPNSVTSIGDGVLAGCNMQIDIDSTRFYSDGYCLIDLSSHRLLCCHRKHLEGYSIPNSVTSIGDWAFAGCESLQYINIPNSVTSIGDWAFAGCESLQYINIPDSVKSIGDSAFRYCTYIRSINIPNSVTNIGDGAFAGCNLQIDIDSSKFYSDGYCLIDLSSHRLLCCHREGLWNHSIPNSVKSIGKAAFAGCWSLKNINIPDSVTSIGDSAFRECESLQSINNPDSVTSVWWEPKEYRPLHSSNIPNSVTNIGKAAFLRCTSLESINIPNSVTSIGDGAFSKCSSLESINIPDSITSIGDGTFSKCSSLESINIPDSVTSIGYSAFAGCESLQSINIPNSVKSIGKAAFSGCWNLKNINIPDSVTSIGGNAFDCCSSLQGINIPNSVTSIGEEAFHGCKSLQSINIPKSVTSIGNKAFHECKSLQSINIPKSVTSIGDWAFKGCSSLQSINIPDSVTSIGDGAFSYCNLQIDIDSTRFYSDGYCLIDLSSHRLLCCHRTDLKNYSVPNSVTSIGDWAFSQCSSLQSINIPDSVTSIGNHAFSSCSSLRSINIPDSVTSIGDGAFCSCSSLQSINIPNSVTCIGNHAFSSCSSLRSINIPNSVTSIRDGAFDWCKSLQSITIPDSVTSIGYSAFCSCSSLQSINIPRGTRAKFERLLPDYKNNLVEIDM